MSTLKMKRESSGRYGLWHDRVRVGVIERSAAGWWWWCIWRGHKAGRALRLKRAAAEAHLSYALVDTQGLNWQADGGTVCVYPWMGRWSWSFNKVTDGYATEELAKEAALASNLRAVLEKHGVPLDDHETVLDGLLVLIDQRNELGCELDELRALIDRPTCIGFYQTYCTGGTNSSLPTLAYDSCE